MTQFRTAIIGCGGIHKVHAAALERMDNVTYAIACDNKEARAKASAETYGAVPETDFEKVLADPTIDVVHLTLPHYLHGPFAAKALKAGKHVLVEKPMAVTCEQARELIALSEETGKTLGVIFQNRYNPSSLKMKEILESGELGKVTCIRGRVSWYRGENYYSDDWHGRWDTECGGVMINQAIHILDLANWFIDNDPVDVQASIHNRLHPNIVVEDTAEGLVQYANGARLLFYATNNYYCDEDVEIRLYCENGTAVLSYDELTIKYNDGTIESVSNNNMRFAYSGGKACWGQQHAAQIRQFYNAVAGNEPLQGTARYALRIQKIICGIYREPYQKQFGN